MPQRFVEVTIQTSVDSGELLAILRDGEALGGWEEKGIIHLYWPEEKWSQEALVDLKSALVHLGVDAEKARLEVRDIADRDWNAAWAASLEPIRLGRKIQVRQSWHTTEADFNIVELVIDPKRAFGTGHHETTQLVIEWLESRICGGERILDIGTGTGILAMAAIRLGAGSALAVDNDPAAFECAREYADANGFGLELELRLGSFDDFDLGSFDVIVANLDGKTLPRLCSVLPRLLKRSGCACLSGLMQQDHEEVAEALGKAGLQINARTQRGEWLALEVAHYS
jgi:ribosomal protein L11 methyltransferase